MTGSSTSTFAPVEPFDVTVDMVLALLPEAVILDTRLAGQKGITKAQVFDWLTERSAIVNNALTGWTTLPDATQRQVKAAGAHVTATAVAAIAQAARTPEAEHGEDSYDNTLWARHDGDLERLRATVTEHLADARATTGTAAGFAFPPPRITDHQMW